MKNYTYEAFKDLNDLLDDNKITKDINLDDYKIIKDKSFEEYLSLYKDAYKSGDLWDFSIDDVLSGAIELNSNIVYWKIGDRLYETPCNNIIQEKVFSMSDKDSMEDAKEFIKKGNESSDVEIVVDVDAKNFKELKKSYVGDLILQCPVCQTMTYRVPEEVIKDETTDMYNVGEACSVCNNMDGYDLVGKVSSLNDSESAEDVNKENDNNEKEEETKNNEKEMIDKNTFESLVNRYLTEVYENVNSYSITSINNFPSELVVEGKIKFKSNKEQQTTFKFNKFLESKTNKKRLYGYNDTFSHNEESFILTCSDNRICECLSYNYNVDASKIHGRIKLSLYEKMITNDQLNLIKKYGNVSKLFENNLNKSFILSRYFKYHTNTNFENYISSINENIDKNKNLDIISLYKKSVNQEKEDK